MNFIDFNRPCIAGKEMDYIKDAIYDKKALCGNGFYTKKCTEHMEKNFGAKKALLTTSCTSALEMSAILLELGPGDEVIVPSFTFVSTANAIVLRGATPVFIDIRKDTLNIDETMIEKLITPKTKAIYAVHYAGIGAEMDAILRVAQNHNIYVVEDAAQGVDARYNGKYLGTIGHLGTYSFHETKNYTCGEGGALLVNDEKFIDRAEILLEKGTNRKKFMEGLVDKYTWVDVGSSYVLSELNAAYLYAQLESRDAILKKRLSIFNKYYAGLQSLQKNGKIQLPFIPPHCRSNGHMFYIICGTRDERSRLMKFLRDRNIQAVFHYVPLHSSPMGVKNGRSATLPVTEHITERLLRLPFFYYLTDTEQDYIIESVLSFYK
ncbi:MAG: dTDP-4-amino-4,6-dideoxygalactose transaminase [Planctomycetes bacterium]|nr:dTDP-4-amino-4,6-dideoxygalactose transaminase [Planctomycetota bacterium]